MYSIEIYYAGNGCKLIRHLNFKRRTERTGLRTVFNE